MNVCPELQVAVVSFLNTLTVDKRRCGLSMQIIVDGVSAGRSRPFDSRRVAKYLRELGWKRHRLWAVDRGDAYPRLWYPPEVFSVIDAMCEVRNLRHDIRLLGDIANTADNNLQDLVADWRK